MRRRLASVTLTLAVGLAALALPAWSADDWASLSPAQKQVLAPLQSQWAGIEAPQKAKWLEVAARFPSLPADERARIQERMAEWSRLTPAERSRARLQFQQSRQVQPDERQARWQAYQALSEGERRELALRAKPAPRPAPATEGAEAAGKRNLVQPSAVPQPRAVSPTVAQAKPGATTQPMTAKTPLPPAHNQAGLPKIAATPGFVDQATLLPKRGPQGAAASRSAASGDPAAQP